LDAYSVQNGSAPNLLALQNLMRASNIPWTFGDVPWGARERSMWSQSQDFSPLQDYQYSRTPDPNDPLAYSESIYDKSGQTLGTLQGRDIQENWIDRLIPVGIAAMAGLGATGLGGAGTVAADFGPGTLAGWGGAGGAAGTTAAELYPALQGSGLLSGAVDFGPGTEAGWGGAGGASGTTAAELYPGLGTAVDPYDAKFNRPPVEGNLPGINAPGVPPIDVGSGLLGQAGDFLKNNPGLMRTVGPLLGGLFGKAVSDNQSGGGPSINMSAQPVTQNAPTMRPWEPSQAMPNGLGSTSAGLFDEYMKQQLGGGMRTFNAPTFGRP
jgi:hypothetical protein